MTMGRDLSPPERLRDHTIDEWHGGGGAADRKTVELRATQTHTTPIFSLCAAFQRPGSLPKVTIGMWATPADRVAAAVPVHPPPQHWVMGRGREEEGKGLFAGFGGSGGSGAAAVS
jgi:hypothetical protein